MIFLQHPLGEDEYGQRVPGGFALIDEDDEPRCQLCGGDLVIKATMIGCNQCGTIWGRCEGAWVEMSAERERKYQEDQKAFDAYEREKGARPSGLTDEDDSDE